MKLNRNLRRLILQGSPWVYRDAVDVPRKLDSTCLVELLDNKKQFLAWGYFSPDSPLAIRILSLDKKMPDYNFFVGLFNRAKNLRKPLMSKDNQCFRLFNGEGDLLPGLVSDIYNDTAVIQFDGMSPFHFWDQDEIAKWLLQQSFCRTVYHKPRKNMKLPSKTWGDPLIENTVQILENGCLFSVDIVDGQKTGFFLDQRDNRNYIKSISEGCKVLNLFSYTGGFSVYAGKGGAKEVTSVDIADEAVKTAHENWLMNDLDRECHYKTVADVFEFLQSHKLKYDIVICDPPSLAKSEKHKEQAINKYVETFSLAAKRVNKGGHLVLSSCSSHISFEDFHTIIQKALSAARLRGQILRVSGQGIDHPYPHACPQLRYLKFVDLVVD